MSLSTFLMLLVTLLGIGWKLPIEFLNWLCKLYKLSALPAVSIPIAGALTLLVLYSMLLVSAWDALLWCLGTYVCGVVLTILLMRSD